MDSLITQLFDLAEFEHKPLFDGAQYPWEALQRLQRYLEDAVRNESLIQKWNMRVVENADGSIVLLGEGVTIEDGATIKGPAIIGAGTEIRSGAYIRGNVIIGERCVIGNSSEVKHAIVMNDVQIPHFNYVGDSILGNHVHLGGGSGLSNKKLSPGTVTITLEDGQVIDSGLAKCGAMLGDGVSIGANAVLNPGVLVGKESVIYPMALVRGPVPAKSILKVKQQQQIVQKQE